MRERRSFEIVRCELAHLGVVVLEQQLRVVDLRAQRGDASIPLDDRLEFRVFLRQRREFIAVRHDFRFAEQRRQLFVTIGKIVQRCEDGRRQSHQVSRSVRLVEAV